MRVTGLFAALVLAGSAVADTPPLFASNEVLNLTIEAPMRELLRNKRHKHEYPATVSYKDSSGVTVSLSAKLSARGNSRLEACDFPPLRLDLHKDDTPGTIFENQNRLKMVTPCGSGTTKAEWMHIEYGIYRAYNEITDFSFRVRPLTVSYEEPESRWNRVWPSFFIESLDAAGARVERVAGRPVQIQDHQFHLVETTKNMLLQFLIANTDFAIRRGPSGEGCCHNGRVITEKGADTGWVVLPYDFDQSGIINTNYALPDERLGIRKVVFRKYRGFCWQNETLPEVIALYNARREAVTAALAGDQLRNSKRKRTRRFVDAFYNIINDSEELQDEIVAECRGASSITVRKTRTGG